MKLLKNRLSNYLKHNLLQLYSGIFFSIFAFIIVYNIFFAPKFQTPGIIDGNTIITGSNNNIALSISGDCSFTGTDYQSVDIFGEGNTFKTQATKDINKYTKKISISGYVEEAYICVISNIREDYKKFEAYRFSTYLYMGGSNYAGNINTEYSKRNSVVYDKDGGSSKNIDGVFRGNEAPYSQIVDLKEVLIADTENGFSRYISPIRLFDDGATLRIGGYTNSYPNRRAGEITKLRIIYKGGNIELSQ